MKPKYSTEELRETESTHLRSLLRERAHHTMETRIHEALCRGRPLPGNFGDAVRPMLAVLEERELPSEGGDLLWARQLLELGEAIQRGETPQSEIPPPLPFTEGEMVTVRELILGRRTIFNWTDKPINSRMVDQILEAGLWAPQACNLQNTRFLLVRDAEDLVVLRGSERKGYQLAIIICQDMRSYEIMMADSPEVNHNLDVGAAVQNMVLMAHALGLGANWMTFVGHQRDRVRAHYQLPDHIRIVTYVVLGWPASGKIPPGRIGLAEALIA